MLRITVRRNGRPIRAEERWYIFLQGGTVNNALDKGQAFDIQENDSSNCAYCCWKRLSTTAIFTRFQFLLELVKFL